MNLNEIAVGDAMSESSHYIVDEILTEKIIFVHLETLTKVELSKGYVEALLKTANQYDTEVEVGMEDKFWTKKKIEEAIKKGVYTELTAPREGEEQQKGIRTLFENIHGDQVFTVEYFTADKPLTAKKYKELRDKQSDDAAAILEQTATSKKGVKDKAKELIRHIQDNHILPFEKGPLRTLTGYKKQFVSRDGKYSCVDMDLPDGVGKENLRLVNINTIQTLVFNGVKYTLE